MFGRLHETEMPVWKLQDVVTIDVAEHGGDFVKCPHENGAVGLPGNPVQNDTCKIDILAMVPEPLDHGRNRTSLAGHVNHQNNGQTKECRDIGRGTRACEAPVEKPHQPPRR